MATETLNSPAYKSLKSSAWHDEKNGNVMRKDVPTFKPVAVLLDEDCSDLEWTAENGEPHISIG